MSRTMTLLFQAAVASSALTGVVFAQCGAPGDCLSVHPDPGCADPDCCSTVCSVDPLCCSSAWDANCVTAANENCVGLCGAAASGDCLVPHPTPSCDRRECCETVCDIDPFCCETEWDFTCTLHATLECSPKGPGECGDADAGSCTEPHSRPACEDADCCELVCKVDPSCCSDAWDLLCAAYGSQFCTDACEPDCPEGAVAEDEDCGQDYNNPCYAEPSPFPSVQDLPCGTWACGRLGSDSGGFLDIDVWSVTVIDEDGDGEVPVRIQFASSVDAFAAFVAAPCSPIDSAISHRGTDFCVELSSETICVAPGEYRLVVAPGDFPIPAQSTLPCGQFGSARYRVRVECLPSGCGPACGPSAGSCFEPRKTPGCDSATCCDAVCGIDPSCCELQWDVGCVQSAQSLCASPPANDECEGAAEIPADGVDVDLVGATGSSPPMPKNCGGNPAGIDVWYSTVAPITGTCTVTTCGSGTFDTALAVYESCEGPPVACNDDGAQCVPETSSRLTFTATCGVTYLVRVVSVDGLLGDARVRVSYGPGPGCGCVADLDGDGTVGGGDLTMLLSSWTGPAGDLDGDGTTAGSDLTIMLSSWGPCP